MADAGNPAENPAALSGNPDEFSRFLGLIGEDYLLLEQNQAQGTAHVRFIGIYRKRPVVWDCVLITLESECRNRRSAGQESAFLRNFIEIEKAGDRGVPLIVGLNIPCIDIPAIRKMIVMIRQYKKLVAGRHEFGDSYRCA